MESDRETILFYRQAMSYLNSLIFFNQLDSLFKDLSYVRHHLTTEVGLPTKVKENYIKYYLSYDPGFKTSTRYSWNTFFHKRNF